MTTVLPAMSAAQTDGWLALLELQQMVPDLWVLVGGQMVHLHCAERGVTPSRPTDDLDAVLDVRAAPGILLTFTSALRELGFRSDGQTPTGHQHRWVRDRAQIDVLIPRHVGERAANRTGVSGGTTLETPAGQQALDRAADVDVVVDGTAGTVRRPSLLGALVGKAAAHNVVLDAARGRHRVNFAVLSTLIARSDRIQDATDRDRRYLGTMIAAVRKDRLALYGVSGAVDGIDTLAEILDYSRGRP